VLLNIIFDLVSARQDVIQQPRLFGEDIRIANKGHMSHSWDGKTFIRTSQIREVIEHQFTATSENDWCDIPVGGVVVSVIG
jgi:hypothetical protein